jgi:hypothetical protein
MNWSVNKIYSSYHHSCAPTALVLELADTESHLCVDMLIYFLVYLKTLCQLQKLFSIEWEITEWLLYEWWVRKKAITVFLKILFQKELRKTVKNFSLIHQSLGQDLNRMYQESYPLLYAMKL